jgi:cobalt/nickel transport system permease protein
VSRPSTLKPAASSSWIADRDPRLRTLAALAFALVTVSLSTPMVALAACAFAAGLALTVTEHRTLLRRMAPLEALMALVLLTLPFAVPGEPLVSFGHLHASREGLLAAMLILLKANAVMLSLLGLLGSLEPMAFGHTLARLGAPAKLVHLLLLTVRQIHLLNQELTRLRQAMRARAFVPRSDVHTWRSYGYLLGMLLVRSLERSHRVLAAMRCRGFNGRLYLLDTAGWRPADTASALLLLLVIAGLLTLDRLP